MSLPGTDRNEKHNHAIPVCSPSLATTTLQAIHQLIEKKYLYFYVSPVIWQATRKPTELSETTKVAHEFLRLWLGTMASKIAKQTTNPIEQCKLAAKTIRMLMVSPDRVHALHHRQTTRRDSLFYAFTLSRLLGGDSTRHSNNHLLALLLRALGMKAWLIAEDTPSPPQVVCVELANRPWVFVDAGMFTHVHQHDLLFSLQEQPNVPLWQDNPDTKHEYDLLQGLQPTQLVKPRVADDTPLAEVSCLPPLDIPQPLPHWNAQQRFVHARLLHAMGWQKAASQPYQELAFDYWTPDFIRQRAAYFLRAQPKTSYHTHGMRLGFLASNKAPSWLVQALQGRYRVVQCTAPKNALRLHLAMGKNKTIVVRFQQGEGPAAVNMKKLRISHLNMENLSQQLALAICQDLARKLSAHEDKLLSLQQKLQAEGSLSNEDACLSASNILAHRQRYLQSPRPEDRASLVLAEYAAENWKRGIELSQTLPTNTFHAPLVVAIAQAVTAGVLELPQQFCGWHDRLICDPETNHEVLASIAYAQRSYGSALLWSGKQQNEWPKLKQCLLQAQQDVVASDEMVHFPTLASLADLRSGLPGLLIQSGRADLAERWLNRFIKEKNDPLGYAWKANLALWRQDLETAQDMAALAWPPDHMERQRLEAGIAVLQQRFEEAIARLQPVIKQAPRDLEGNTWMAEALLASGRQDEGYHFIQKVMHVTNHLPARIIGGILTFPAKMEPDKIFSQHFDGVIGETLPGLLDVTQTELYAQGKEGWKLALHQAKKLLGGNRSSWPIQLKNGQLSGFGEFSFSRELAGGLQYRVNIEPFDQLLEHFEKLEAEWPASPHIWTFRGELLLWAGRYEEAEAHFHEALRIRSCRWGYVGLATAAMFQNKLDQTKHFFAAMNRKYEPVERSTTPVYQGRLARLEKRFEDAETSFAIATDEVPARIGAWAERGLNAHALGHHALTTQCIDEIQRRCPALLWRAQSSSANSPLNDIDLLENCLTLLGTNRASRMVTIVEDNQLVRLPDAEGWSLVASEALRTADQKAAIRSIRRRKVFYDADPLEPYQRAPAIVRPRAVQQIEDEFLEKGWVHLQGAIPTARVKHWVETAFSRLNHDPNKWSDEGISAMPSGRISMHEHPISRVTFIGDRVTPIHIFSTKLCRAVHTLIGDRCPQPSFSNRLIIAPPARKQSFHEWHVDEPLKAATFSQLKLSLLMLIILHDAQEERSGTMFLEGSPAALGKKLAATPQGLDLSARKKTLNELVRDLPHQRSATGRAGDVYLFHPWTLHAPGKGTAGQLRILANPNLIADTPIYRPGEPRNPVERLIHNAIG